MNVTERGQAADAIAAQVVALSGAAPADVLAIGGMLAAKLVVAALQDPRGRSDAVRALTSAMNAQLALETAGEHRVSQPIGRLGMEDED